jgi:diguanylate cyclase (GGDEF)-like protein
MFQPHKKYEPDELFRLATTDSLTGLANRALFIDRLQHDVERSRRDDRRLAILMIDMDGLKPINDGFGHRTGDAAIKEIACRIAAVARRSDTVARLGGDEFAVILSTIESPESAQQAAERIAEQCSQPFTFEGRSLAIGASIGLAICPDDGDEVEELLEKADQCMYACKRQKKGLEPTR